MLVFYTHRKQCSIELDTLNTWRWINLLLDLRLFLFRYTRRCGSAHLPRHARLSPLPRQSSRSRAWLLIVLAASTIFNPFCTIACGTQWKLLTHAMRRRVSPFWALRLLQWSDFGNGYQAWPSAAINGIAMDSDQELSTSAATTTFSALRPGRISFPVSGTVVSKVGTTWLSLFPGRSCNMCSS